VELAKYCNLIIRDLIMLRIIYVKKLAILCSVLSAVSVYANDAPLSIVNDSGLIPLLTGSSLTGGLLSVAFDQGLPLGVGLLSDSALTPIVEQGTPLLLEGLEPLLSAPYQLNGIVD
jgi:hypothetical protein